MAVMGLTIRCELVISGQRRWRSTNQFLDQLQGELVQADLVVEPMRSADSQTSCRSVEVVQPGLGNLLGADGVDSDQDEGELVLGAWDLLQEPLSRSDGMARGTLTGAVRWTFRAGSRKTSALAS